jgi:hypothetical protein
MKKALTKIRILRVFCTLTTALLVALAVHPALAESEVGAPHHPAWSSPLVLFQRVISRADGNRCPMAPSCSHYAATVFKQHHPATAWILTCDRLLRCGHDEVRLAPRLWDNGHVRAYDPVDANTFWWRKP